MHTSAALLPRPVCHRLVKLIGYNAIVNRRRVETVVPLVGTEIGAVTIFPNGRWQTVPHGAEMQKARVALTILIGGTMSREDFDKRRYRAG